MMKCSTNPLCIRIHTGRKEDIAQVFLAYKDMLQQQHESDIMQAEHI